MRKRVFISVLILFLTSGISLRAQQLYDLSAFYPSAGIQAGALGLGIEGSYPLGNAFNVRLGANVFPSARVNFGQNGVKVRRSNIMLNADWQPLFGGRSWFARRWFVSAGGSYFFKNEIHRLVDYSENNDNYNYKIKMHQSAYIGSGFSGIRLGERLNLSVNVGYFIPLEKPEVIMEDTGEIHTMRKQNIEDDLSSFPLNIVRDLNGQATISWWF